ncbi:MAG: respiratory nitrate reductase subunit gamma [Planctomycetes bacterium]|nr:respiratory nitrate reductase subunit gamma [Planctomycetota bacterium]
MSEFLWGTYPYLCIVLFFLVPIIRMATRPYSWSSRASSLFSARLLGFASLPLHWGLALLLVGHLLGLFGGLLGSELAIALFYWIGLLGGFLLLVGSSIALYRRFTVPQVRAMSQREDFVVLYFLITIVGLALYQVIVHRTFGVAFTASSWAASLWTLSPQPELMASTSLITKLHVFLALTFFAYFPFTKLVHFWTYPVNYFVRPYQSMRTSRYRFQRRWEFTLRSDKSWLIYGMGTVALLFLVAGIMLPSGESAAATLNGTRTAGLANGKLTGRGLYVSQCARCHGTSGRGDGAGAKSPTFSTRPRDFVTAHYHFVTTENAIASDDDLFRAIRSGLPGSGMPAYTELTNEQIWSLVAVLNEFREGSESPGPTLAVGTPPLATPESIARGRTLYESCTGCHGPEGRGDGGTIAYDWRELPIKPRNLAAGELKIGRTPEQLYMRIVLGIPGGYGGAKLMPDFSVLPESDRWALVHFLESEILPPASDGP